MTTINLLPPEKIKKKVAPRGNLIWLSLILPVIVMIAIGIWWFSMGSQVSEKDEEISAKKQTLEDWQFKNEALQPYETRLAEIKAKEEVVVRAISGRVYWAQILLNIANMCPSDVWLYSINCSSSETEGTVDFEGYTTQCRNRWNKNIDDQTALTGLDKLPLTCSDPWAFLEWLDEYQDLRFHPDATMGGEYAFYPDYRPLANWIERMEQVEQFARVWLSSADPEWHPYWQIEIVGTNRSHTVADPLRPELVVSEPYEILPGVSVCNIEGIEYLPETWSASDGEFIMVFHSTAKLDMPKACIGEPLDKSGAAAAPAQPATQEEESEEEGGTEEE